jgi:hypothetical protein
MFREHVASVRRFEVESGAWFSWLGVNKVVEAIEVRCHVWQREGKPRETPVVVSPEHKARGL